MTITALMSTPFGTLFLEADELGMTQIRMATIADVATENTSKYIDATQTQLTEYFEGNRQTFDLCLHPIGTDFQQKVWRELQNIPYGRAVSYLEMSKRLGNVKAIRAAASANGKNPLLIVIPCHRVIGKDGSLTGFTAGLAVKKWLLEHESEAKQQSLF
ncbi:methylated-DNA--[protein]-cysteine S-methyltransferase [Flavobacterium sp. NKUCC04_CG]|uniref:methylated-DNA--[protein]-cysteine S-methyltransferase n=1 Tax=Flavobacterium sp. NKUCC04_CG TaxID=2842121 RepID=UPI00210829A6|nr:methylated-DNA--[protein]-cysteine S-methyltransferase [Flavobacterium sp. NKUCC04_CG]